MWSKTIQVLPSKESMTDESDKLETESFSVTGAPSSNKDFGLQWPIFISAVLDDLPTLRKTDPRHLDFWLSRKSTMKPDFPFPCDYTRKRSLPCSIAPFSSLWFSLSSWANWCHHSVHVLPSVTAFKQIFAVHFGAKSKGPKVATSCLNNGALHQFAIKWNTLYCRIITANTFPANGQL